MARDAALLGVAIVLTLLAGLALAAYEDKARSLGLRFRGFSRPGGVALLFGAGVAGLLGGYLGDNLFVLVAGAVAALSGLPMLRTGGRLSSFLVLLVGALAVVVVVDAEIPAFGVRGADVVLTAFALTCLCGVLRELDAAGSAGWAGSVGLAAAMTVMFVSIGGDSPDTAVGVLTTGALFGTVAAAPFGSGMLGRVGARFAGLVIGGLSVRGAVGSPAASLAVVAASGVVVLAWIATLPRPYRGRVAAGGVAVAALLAVASVPALLAVRDSYRPLRRVVATSRSLVRANPTDDLATTTAKLSAVEASARRSARRLDTPAAMAGRFVPFLSANLRAATVSATSTADLAASARQLLGQINVGALSVDNGVVAQPQLDRLADALRTVQVVIRDSYADVGRRGGTDLLVPELREAVGSLRAQLRAVQRRVDVSLDGTVAAKRLLGFDRPRRYFVAVQNNAESRATGGYVANYGILVTDRGRISLPEFRRTSEFDEALDRPRVLRADRDYSRRYSRFDVDRNWTNVNMSPDFPTVAAIMADQYRQYSGRRVDGVLAVDPVALGRLLRLTGPVRVPNWPAPITARNAVSVLLHDQYVAFDARPNTVRIDFVGHVAKRVFDQLVATGLRDLRRAAPVVAQLTTSRHLQFFSTDDLATRFFAATRADGAMPPLRGDALMVTTQNAAANKLDFYLRRRVTYNASVRPEGDKLRVDATVTVELHNTAPSSGEPRYVIGPFDSRFEPGQHRVFLTVYSPLRPVAATVDGEVLEVDGAPELGRLAHSAFLDVPAGGRRRVELRLRGVVERRGRGYALDIVRQPLVHDDELHLALDGAGENGHFRRKGSLTRNVAVELPVSAP